MKHPIAAATAVAASLATAVVALAAPNADSGKYRGRTAKKDPVTFRVTAGKELVHFTHKGVAMKCSDGVGFHVRKLDSGPKRLYISDAGKFKFRVDYDEGGFWIVRGRVKGKTAKGYLRMKVRFNSNNVADKHGKIRCDSGKLRFKAKHR